MTAARLWILTVVAALVLLASLGFAALRLSWHLGGYTGLIPMDVPAGPVDQTPEAPRDIKAILALAPFGQVAVVDAPGASSAPATSLKLALRGVLVDPDPSHSRAFILSEGKTAVFRIGEAVQSTELVAINTDTVTLKSGEKLLVVGFGGVQDGAGPSAQTVAPLAENPNDPFARLAAAIVPGQGSIDLREAPPPETTDEYINLWRDRITQNPQAAMDTIGLEQVENGYRIKANPNIGVTLAGLKTGDVVTRLNGQTVGDLNKDRALYDDVAASGIARLEVVRDGQALLLTFPLR
ncbi:MAG: general secretion pathway protein C [Sulfitobacter sp.]|jgi:general secretion pathway protein C